MGILFFDISDIIYAIRTTVDLYKHLFMKTDNRLGVNNQVRSLPSSCLQVDQRKQTNSKDRDVKIFLCRFSVFTQDENGRHSNICTDNDKC